CACVSCQAFVKSDAFECNTLDDCFARGPAFASSFACSDTHVCVAVPCTTHAECVAKAGSAGAVCRPRDGTCARLSADCATLLGDTQAPAGVLFGALLSTTQANSYLGVPERNAIDLALADFASYSGLPPVPPSSTPRGLAVVACDDGGDLDVAER